MTVALGILLSGGGRTLQNLLDQISAGKLGAEIRCVIADRPALGLERARAARIPAFMERNPTRTFDILRAHRVELVCMAGYLRLLQIPKDFVQRVVNIHPALLPKFGGKGFYGNHVHEAVLAARETETGCTVHFCDDQYDHGQVLIQRKVRVSRDDTVESLANKVFAAECEAYPDAIRLWAMQHRDTLKKE